jgi:hypothetical protein
MLVLVPVFALLVRLVTRRSDLHYPQHLYFALHVHAAWMAVWAIAEAASLLQQPVLRMTLQLTGTACSAGYLALALRRAYDFRFGGALWRTGLIVVLYTVVVVVVAAAIAAPTLLRLMQR